MVRHPKFIYVHLQKCAGTFVSTYLDDNISKTKWNPHQKHLGLNVRPKNKFIFGTIRNPFDWYVSWYIFGVNVHGKFSKNKTFPEFMELLYEQKGMLHDINMNICNRDNIGVYTFRHNKVFNIYPDFICRFENLEEDLIKCFDENNFPLNEEQKEILYNTKKINTSQHSHYSEYHNDKTIEIIMERDKLIIDKYGYKFETK